VRAFVHLGGNGGGEALWQIPLTLSPHSPAEWHAPWPPEVRKRLVRHQLYSVVLHTEFSSRVTKLPPHPFVHGGAAPHVHTFKVC
jgi:hypothetical protein